MNVVARRGKSLSDWLLVGFVLWFGSYAYLYAFSLGGPKPLYSYCLLLGFAFLRLLHRSALHQSPLLRTDPELRAFVRWLFVYLVYGSLEFVHSTQDSVAVQSLITLGEAVLLAGVFAALLSERDRLFTVTSVLAFLALTGSGAAVFDFLVPTFSDVPGRGAGLYVNPTIAGNFLALAMVGGMGAIPRRRRLIYLLACGVGILVTFSREAWIIWGVGVVWLGCQGAIGGLRSRQPIAVLTICLGAGCTVLLFSGKLGDLLADSPLQAYLTSNTAARLGIGSSVLSGDAASERKKVITVSIEEVEHYPWFGRGLGYTSEWRYLIGPHDMYLLFLVEGGVLGLAVFLGLIVLLWRAGVGGGRVIAVQIIVSSLFTHNHLEQPTVLMMIAYVFAHGAVVRGAGRQPLVHADLVNP